MTKGLLAVAVLSASLISGCRPKLEVLAAPRPVEATALRVFKVRDNGKRCIVAPCPSWTITDEKTGEELEVARVDLTPLGLSMEEQVRTRKRVDSGKARVEGTIVVEPKAGPGGDATVLSVTRVVDEKR